MNQSPELKQFVLRYYGFFSSGDYAAAARCFSRREGALAIGTDPDEWWVGYEAILRAFAAQGQAIGAAIQIRAGDLVAYADGTLGWAADRPTVRLPNGTEIRGRQTLVLQKESGEWKIVHAHSSLGVPNTQSVGKDLPV